MTGCASSGLDGIPAQCVEAVSEAVALPNVVSLGRLEPLGSRPVEDGRDHVDDFISSLKLPVGEALIKSPPRLRVSLVPRILTSSHGGAPGLRTGHVRDNVLLKKWGFETPSAPSQAGTATRFSETLRTSLSSSKREAMRELFPDRARRCGRTFVSEASPRR